MSIALFLLALALLAAAVVMALIVGRIRSTLSRRTDEAQEASRVRAPGYAIPLALALLGVGMLGMSATSIVPTKQVGIPVTFGKPGTPVSNGLHLKAPWTQMVKMDATIQSLDASEENPTVAKDVDRADVFVHNNVRWSIKEEAADSLYRDYREFSNINDSLVQPALRESVAAVISTYNPLGEANPSNTEIADQIQTTLQNRVGDRVTIHEVTVTLLDFSDATKDRINALNTERGNTRIAEQRKQTAAAEAEANRILSDSVSEDPNVLVSRCLDLIAEGKSVPAGFQCWPGQSTGSEVIVDSRPAPTPAQ